MPKFLNTQGLSEWISRIIDETQRELVIISPYLQLSNKIFQKLMKANDRGVEIIFIYRELQVKESEKGKLLAIDNLNLMYHPNIHAKCMYNENFLLIGSMNLYEYSEKNNREMGILFHKMDIPELGDDTWGNADNDNLFDEALEEIIEIKNGAEMERPSRETVEDKFELDILKNKLDKTQEYVKLINDIFIHKKFIVIDNNVFLCKSYMDKVDVTISSRIEFFLNLDKNKLNQLYRKYENNIKSMEFSFSGFKFYWNTPVQICLYNDSKHPFWDNIETNEATVRLRKKGIDEVIQFIKSEIITNNNTYNNTSAVPAIGTVKLTQTGKAIKETAEIKEESTKVKEGLSPLSPFEIGKIKESFKEKFPESKINSTAEYVYCNHLLPYGDVMFREGFEIRFINVRNHNQIIDILRAINFEKNHYKYEQKLTIKNNQPPYLSYVPQGVNDIQKLIYDYIFMTKTILDKTRNIEIQKMFI